MTDVVGDSPADETTDVVGDSPLVASVTLTLTVGETSAQIYPTSIEWSIDEEGVPLRMIAREYNTGKDRNGLLYVSRHSHKRLRLRATWMGAALPDGIPLQSSVSTVTLAVDSKTFTMGPCTIVSAGTRGRARQSLEGFVELEMLI